MITVSKTRISSLTGIKITSEFVGDKLAGIHIVNGHVPGFVLDPDLDHLKELVSLLKAEYHELVEKTGQVPAIKAVDEKLLKLSKKLQKKPKKSPAFAEPLRTVSPDASAGAGVEPERTAAFFEAWLQDIALAQVPEDRWRSATDLRILCEKHLFYPHIFAVPHVKSQDMKMVHILKGFYGQGIVQQKWKVSCKKGEGTKKFLWKVDDVTSKDKKSR